MPRRYVVSKMAKKAPPQLPKEVTLTAPRAYVDRWGIEYDVWWNGQPGDPPLTRSYTAEAST